MKNTNILDKIVGINKSLGAQLHKCIKKMVSVAKTSKGIAICSTFVVLVTLTVVSMVIIGAKKMIRSQLMKQLQAWKQR